MNTGNGGFRRTPLYAGAAGMIVLAALTAFAVVALGSSPDDADAAGPRATASSTASGTVSGTPRTAAAATPSRTAGAAATTARPGGQVAHGVHSGDLRWFLLPLPAGADSYGDPAGGTLSAGDIAASAEDPAVSRRALKVHDFQAGAFRTYLTADGRTEVTVRLERFGSPAQAAGYYAGHYYNGVRIALDTPYSARAYRLASSSAESTDTVIALSYEGDVCFTVSATGSSTPSRAALRALIDAQHHRLATGR